MGTDLKKYFIERYLSFENVTSIPVINQSVTHLETRCLAQCSMRPQLLKKITQEIFRLGKSRAKNK